MKKNIIIVILFGSLIGYLFGSIIFKNYKGSDLINEDGNIYYLQYGVYTTIEAANSNTENLKEEHFIKELDNKYYVYLGVTTDYDKALKLKEKYENENIHIYIRSDFVENSETLKKLKEYDEQIDNLDNTSEVMKKIFENSNLNL
ncbi:MAG: hypothetical protein IKN63_04405 [Bacilli bacterium]|nr:hypothetical protein [Bacilli bacterium]